MRDHCSQNANICCSHTGSFARCWFHKDKRRGKEKETIGRKKEEEEEIEEKKRRERKGRSRSSLVLFFHLAFDFSTKRSRMHFFDVTGLKIRGQTFVPTAVGLIGLAGS